MTAPKEARPEDGAMMSPWRGTTPEVITAAVAVTAAGLAAYATGGWAGLAAVAVATAAGAMVLLRALLPVLTPDAAKKARQKRRAVALSGYAYRRSIIYTAITSRNYYDAELRPILEHLLAARLAERHNVHLYQDHKAARLLLCRNPRDADLWWWIDPATRPQTTPRDGPDRRGIPRDVLARLIDRLEEL